MARNGLIKAVLAAGLCSISLPLIAAPIELSVNTTAPGASINRDVFGQFVEHLGEGVYGGIWVGPDSPIPNVRGIRSDVVGALRALKVPVVRWPGGCYADEYHWREGIAPQSARKSRINGWGNVVDSNAFGTHEFFDFLGQIDSEAYISINIGTGTPQEAADWLEYMTAAHPTSLAQERAANGRAEPWRVKYAGLGNESWGCGGGMSADVYVGQMTQFATFARNYHPEQYPLRMSGKPAAFPMQMVAVGQGPGETAYTEAVMKAWQTRVPYAWNINAISLHFYTGVPHVLANSSVDFGEDDYALLLKDTLRMDAMLAEHSAIMDVYDPDKKVGLAIDEWGLWLKPTGANFGFLRQEQSLRDGIAAALNLNIFARHADRVRMTNIAQMVNVIQAMVLTDGPNMVLTPSYHVYKMYIPFQDAKVLPVKFNAGEYAHNGVSMPRLDAVAVRAKDGSVWLSLINVDPNSAMEIDISAMGFNAKTAVGETLTAAGVDTTNTFSAPNRVVPKPVTAKADKGELVLNLPAKSVAVVQLR